MFHINSSGLGKKIEKGKIRNLRVRLGHLIFQRSLQWNVYNLPICFYGQSIPADYKVKYTVVSNANKLQETIEY